MAQARIDEKGIRERQERISRIEQQISIWRATSERTPGMEIIRKAIEAGRKVEKDEIVQRCLTLQFSTEADRADLAKHSGTLAAFDKIYYDIFEGEKKIDGAEMMISKLQVEIDKAKKGELLETGA